MLRARYEILMVDSETGAQTVHSRKRTLRGAITQRVFLNTQNFINGLERMGPHYTDHLYFSIRDRKEAK